MSLDLEQLTALQQASEAAQGHYRAPPPPSLPLCQPLVADRFTQLWHTPWWERLSSAQQLRYNQLSGLRANELFMLFEAGFTQRVVARLQRRLQQRQPLLADCLRLMLLEEGRHHALFLAFNRALLPAAYGDAGGYFARPGQLAQGLLALVGAIPGRWPLLVWLILLLEEFSTAFSRQLLAEPGLAPSYVELHRLHLLDEARHVQLDASLIELLSAELRPWANALNGRLFRYLLAELLAPKRSGIRVLHHLVAEFPALRPALPQMVAAVRALGRDPGLAELIDSPQALPLTHALLQRYPAFHWR